jgi:NAD(P)-dependent dehydrogenase (short-subunit alcohol dehydrogenase family)
MLSMMSDSTAVPPSVNSMAQTSAFQLRASEIRVNSICPGLIETGMTADTFTSARQRGRLGKVGQLNALGRFGVAEGQSSRDFFHQEFDHRRRNCEHCVVPGKRYGSDAVLARFILTSRKPDESSYINGQILAVDGGLSASHPVVLGKMA